MEFFPEFYTEYVMIYSLNSDFSHCTYVSIILVFVSNKSNLLYYYQTNGEFKHRYSFQNQFFIGFSLSTFNLFIYIIARRYKKNLNGIIVDNILILIARYNSLFQQIIRNRLRCHYMLRILFFLHICNEITAPNQKSEHVGSIRVPHIESLKAHQMSSSPQKTLIN